MTDRAPTEPRARAANPITVEIIGSALSSIVEEMGETLVRASFSANIKERRDCSTALFDISGQTLCQAEHIPIHLGSFIGILPHILKRHPVAEMRPGDVFIGNDAYEGGGTHLPDVVLAEPIFFGDEIVAWAVNTAHHSDFADRGDAHIYQEGIRLPPVRLYRAGVLQEDTLSIFLLNCQVPHERQSDLRAQMAANRLGAERVQKLCAKYGVGTFRAASDELLRYAERKMRAGIAALPDGQWSFADVFEDDTLDRPMEMACTVTVSGDRMTLDFDAPKQGRNSRNMTFTALQATVYYAVKGIIDPSILPNAGLSRPLEINAPLGTVVNCEHPAAVHNRLAPAQRVVDLIHGALAQVIPEKLTAAHNGTCAVANFSGRHPRTGRHFVIGETMGGGFGARATKDGLSGVHVHLTNTANLPVEAIEEEYPLTVVSYELVRDSGGPGQFRGGMGLRRQYRAEADLTLRYHTSRITSAPWGLNGGLPGGHGAFEAEGLERTGREAGRLHRGSWIAVTTPGAGGYGDPRKRARALVEQDLREDRISAEVARAVYGLDVSS